MATDGPRFGDLIAAHEREIFRYLTRLTGNPDDSADALQETFLRAFAAFAQLRPGSNHRAWLYRIASRQGLNLIRARRTRRTAPLTAAAGVVDPDGGAERLLEGRRLEGALDDVLGALTARQRGALLLRKYDGLSYAEVAAALGCSEETARAHVHQAMKRVRRALAATS